LVHGEGLDFLFVSIESDLTGERGAVVADISAESGVKFELVAVDVAAFLSGGLDGGREDGVVAVGPVREGVCAGLH